MEQAQIAAPVRRWGQTARPDTWWIQPLAVFLGFSAFVVYATWAAFQGEFYHVGPYLSLSIHPSCSASRLTASSARDPVGGRSGYRSRRRF